MGDWPLSQSSLENVRGTTFGGLASKCAGLDAIGALGRSVVYVHPSLKNMSTPSILTNSSVTPHFSQTVSSLRARFEPSCGVSQPGQFRSSSRDAVLGARLNGSLNGSPRWRYCTRDLVRLSFRAQRKFGLGNHRGKIESSRSCCKLGFQARSECF